MDTTIQEAKSDIICEFLEVSFHLILCVRGIYPKAVFQPRRKYNAPVQMCCHQGVNQYIRNTLQTIEALLLQGAVEKVVLLLVAPDKTPLDSYSFIIQNVILSKESSKEDNYLVELEDSLRSALLKINISDTVFKTNIPPNSSFSIQVHTNKQAVSAIQHNDGLKDFPWTEVTPSQNSSGSRKTVLPLNSINSQWLKMSVHMETTQMNSET